MPRLNKIGPSWLSALAQTEWSRVIKLPGVIESEPDESTVASYCVAFARWRQAEGVIDAEGSELVLRDDKGVVRSVSVSPQVAISEKYHKLMLVSAKAIGIGR